MAGNQVLIGIDDDRYPPLLRQAVGAPQALYCLGDPAAMLGQSVSVIGSRKMTGYGEKVARLLVPDLVTAGLAIVSGLAYGVDGLAHELAVEWGGRCVAVLGCGLDRLYPSAHRALAERIVDGGGCLVSEYPPGTPPLRHHFPERNRIVAGLSQMTLIIEAGERSGTLITARQALEAGRDVGVVPADITREESRGVHSLLKQGARPVTSSDDVLSLYGPRLPLVISERLRPALTGSMATLYDLISHGVTTTDALTERTSLGIAELQSVLSVLELDGYIYYRNTEWQRT